ncbi:flagellar hook protein FlgE [Azospirillum sp. SYSU D00513]|uniref:flagellar hook protein FlgE n=1 Tax=Azospirillum sp. SYSU D00513 TaxID=2812561 RepID=UPI001A96D2F5|nr:flagellar hook protein FlgE [Azospirillum sp. SYSU D00513]
MSLQSALMAGVSGMRAQSSNLAAIGDNITNSQTLGYKASSMEFASLVTSAGNRSYSAGGVSGRVAREIDNAGTIISSTSPTDIAIMGEGFFIVKGGLPSAQDREPPLLTRLGQMKLDSAGNLKVRDYYVQGYKLANDGTVSATTPQSIQINRNPSIPTPSTSVSFTTNLPALANADTTYTTYATYTDSLGTPQDLAFKWTRTAENTWSLSIPGTDFVDQSYVFSATGATAGFPVAHPTGNVPGLSLTVGGQTLDIKLSVTQFDYDYVPEYSSNGVPVSDFADVEVGQDGVLYSVYKNGTRTPQYRLAMGDVANPNGLSPAGSDAYMVTQDSGILIPRFAGEGTVGTLQSNALEQSNVDIAEEMTDLIVTQRAYSSNGKVVQTADEMYDVIENLKR